jgi:Flp pilus assembly pilin Flp
MRPASLAIISAVTTLGSKLTTQQADHEFNSVGAALSGQFASP